jgi:uncharacterized protein with gpF-like domain
VAFVYHDQNIPEREMPDAHRRGKACDKTLEILNKALAQKPEGGQYIWRSVGDYKVRDSHATLNGILRHWSDSPDPGEEFGCRCWAEHRADFL